MTRRGGSSPRPPVAQSATEVAVLGEGEDVLLRRGLRGPGDAPRDELLAPPGSIRRGRRARRPTTGSPRARPGCGGSLQDLPDEADLLGADDNFLQRIAGSRHREACFARTASRIFSGVRQVADAHADSVGDGVHDGGGDRDDAGLGHALGPVGPRGIARLHEDRLDGSGTSTAAGIL